VSSEEIELRAGHWLARRDRSDWTEQDEILLQQWLEQSTAHVVAFVRLEAAWTEAKRLQALAGGIEPGTVPSVEEWGLARFFDPATGVVPSAPAESSSRPRRGLLRGLSRWGLAASVLIAIAVGLVRYWPPGTSYSTPVGGIVLVPMSDGSRVTLNTDSKIRLDLTETQRLVELQQGEAFFEVAKDPSRPFVVAAGPKRVVAVGTKFSVRRDGDEVQVFVTEGRVRVEDTEPVANAHDSLQTLAAGSLARGDGGALLVQHEALPEIERQLSWRAGYLLFRDTPLSEAVAEFNRYNPQQIVIGDPGVGAIRISGKFRPTQYEAFLRLMQKGFAVRTHRAGDAIVIGGSGNTGGGAGER